MRVYITKMNLLPIAEVKRLCGFDMGENYNKSKKENPIKKQCPEQKVEYIKEALRYLEMRD